MTLWGPGLPLLPLPAGVGQMVSPGYHGNLDAGATLPCFPTDSPATTEPAALSVGESPHAAGAPALGSVPTGC